MAANKLNGADYLLLLLYLDGGRPIKGAIRLTKMMFLFKEEIEPILKQTGLESENLPGFIAYNFGPFSQELYEQVEFFENIKFIKTKDIKAEEMGEVDDWRGEWFDGVDDPVNLGYAMDSKYIQYEIADRGRLYVESKILGNLSEQQKKLLLEFKMKIVKTSAKNILRYVYTKYEKYAENSIIKKEVLGDDGEN